MANKIGRSIKIEPNEKTCTICKVLKTIDNFPLSPIPTNPNLRRNQCTDCRNKQSRERLADQNAHQERYRAMSAEKRAEYIKKRSEQNKRRFKTNPQALANKKAYDKSDKGIYKRYTNECNRRGRLVRGIQMELSLEQFSALINSPCHYCGTLNSRGVDRLDSSGSYTLENSKPCCHDCNEMKNDKTEEQFIAHIRQIIKNRGL